MAFQSREDLEGEDSGSPDFTNRTGGNEGTPITQDLDGRILTRTIGARADQMRDTSVRQTGTVIDVEDEGVSETQRLNSVVVDFESPSTATVEVTLEVDTEFDESFSATLVKETLDNDESFFFQPDNRFLAGPGRNFRLQVSDDGVTKSAQITTEKV